MPTKTKRKPTKTAKTKTTRKVKKSTTTLVSFILDETGSMQAVKVPTITGFNEYLGTLQKNNKGETLFTLTKFHSARVQIVHNQLPIEQVPQLTDATYTPDNMTPLYDAIGRTINAIDLELKGRKDKPNVLVTIMTDGEENDSREFTRKAILDLITDRTKKGWVFTYLGANQDAWAVGATLGLSKGNTMSYDQNHTKGVLSAVATASANYLNASVSGRKGMATRGLLNADNMGVDEDTYQTLTGGTLPPKA